MRLASAVLALLLAGCGAAPRTAPFPGNAVRVEWLGHNCFLLSNALGIAVLVDPFEPKYFDYPVRPNLRPDIVLITSEQPQVSNADLAGGSPQVFRNFAARGDFGASGIPFRGVLTSDGTAESAANVAFSWTINGLRFCHLGLIDRALDDDAVAELGRVDVLFLPVGNPLSLTDAARVQIVAQLHPRIVVPMSYANVRTTRLGFAPPDAWLAMQGHRVSRLATSSFTLDRTRLPAKTTVFLPAVP